MLPLLVTLLAVDLAPLIDNPTHFTIGTYVGAAIRYIVLFAVGGIVAALNSDEVRPIKLVQLGIAAPALISTYVNAQQPKPPATQTAAVHSGMLSLDLISRAYAADTGNRSNRPIVVAGFLSDVIRSATAPLAQQIVPPAVPPPPAPSNEDIAAVNQALENARTSAATATTAAAKAADDAAKLDQESTPATISSVQKSAADAHAAAQQAQSDIKILGEVSKMAVSK